MTRFAMVIDLKKCIGCHACSVACKVNNNLPVDLWYNRVLTDGSAYMDTASGTYPNDVHREHIPMTCQHCSNAPCATVCPTGATSILENGVVAVDAEQCIGCGSCIEACPYDVRTLIKEEPKFVMDFALGDWDAPEHKAGVVEKCTFCQNRVERGEVPARPLTAASRATASSDDAPSIGAPGPARRLIVTPALIASPLVL